MSPKDRLRHEMRRLQDACLPDSGALDAYARAAWEAVENSAEFSKAHSVLAYMSIPGEIPTLDFIRRWNGPKRILIPKVEGRMLALYEYGESSLCEGYRGILEPDSSAVEVDPSEVELALVPGVAFSRVICSGGGVRWARLGRGKGFYDRLLPRLGCPLVGIGFPFRVVQEVPLDPWDILLDDYHLKTTI